MQRPSSAAPNAPADAGKEVSPRGMRSVGELVAAALVDAQDEEALESAAIRLPVAVSGAMAGAMTGPDDPIARQLIPDVRELDIAPEERADPIGDTAHSPLPGLVHRYEDRVLLKPTHLCAVYCRFCFRGDEVGDPARATLPPGELDAALAYVREHTEVWEVILTGGDPLVLSPRRLRSLMEAVAAIEHVQVIRIHSRVPLVKPEAVTPALIDALRVPIEAGKATWLVLHANHAQEITDAGRRACASLVDRGIPLLSQSVLLRGVNDSVDALSSLLRGLVQLRIKPYYLHHLDLVEGTSHLRVPLEEGLALVRALRGRVSGLCIPTYVLDIPGGFGKIPLGQAWVEGPDDDGAWWVTDPQGEVHVYDEGQKGGAATRQTD